MTVHIDELHSDVTPVDGPTTGDRSGDDRSAWVAQERWAMLNQRIAWLADRTNAECFDD